jgi:hypothetical protein
MENTPSKRLIITQILVIFVLPVLLLYFKIFPTNWRIVLLVISSLFIYGIIRHERWVPEDMGVRHDNFRKAFPFYLFFTALGVLILFLISSKVKLPEVRTIPFYIKTIIFFIPSSFFQEFAFRSFLIPRLKIVFNNNNYYIIFFNTILFVFMHIIYLNWGIILPLLSIMGVLFAWLYIKYPNLILVSVAHSILNVIAVLLGFFVIN